MSLLRRAKARDANEGPIFAALRAVGAEVYALDRPVDALVGYRGRNWLLEVKAPLGPKGGKSSSPLTPSQRRFMLTWRGQVALVRTPAEALAAIGARERPYQASQAAPGATIAPQDDAGIGPD